MKTFKEFLTEGNKQVIGKAHYTMIEAALWIDMFAKHGCIEGVDLNPKEKRELAALAKKLEMSAKELGKMK